MSHTQRRRRASHTRCARRSLVELTAAASRAVDDGLFVLSSGIAASNPRLEHTGEKTSDQTILARQATAPSPVAVLESRNATAPKNEFLDSDTATEMMVKIAKDYQNRAFENITEAATEVRADAVELIVQQEPAAGAGQPQPRYMRRLTDEAVRLLDDLRSGQAGESGELHPERMLQRSRQRVLYDQSAAQARRLCREH